MGIDIYSIVGSALDAQDARMGAIAANLANVDSITPPGGTPYRAHEVVFEAAPVAGGTAGGAAPDLGRPETWMPETGMPEMGVSVAGTVQSNAPPVQTYDPGNPYANAKGYVTGSNVSQVDEMVDLIDSSNSYAASVAVLQQSSRVDQQMLASFQVS
jgi:flagellar basal-body rod protein FlgC